MKGQFTFWVILLALHTAASAQSTAARVYEIFQTNCISCHNNANPEAGLDLEGAGATAADQMLDVYSNVVGVSPANSYAASQGYDYIHPGRPDKSFLFRKVSQGLEPTIELHGNEGAPMPKDLDPLSELERELIRQWILYGAPVDGTVVNENLLVDFYNGQGDVSFTTPPPAPDPSEGFQVKMGPFYLAPAGQGQSELEYFQKYALDLLEDIEVNRIEILISPYSHHLIIYDWESPQAANSVPDGFRLDPFHQGISITAAAQEPTDLKLPGGTAFRWKEGLVLDLNAHYINYSATTVYQAEAYLNIYTQPMGTAAQEMRTELLVNDGIYIPNNGDLINASQTINWNLGEIFMWAFAGHTHRYGTGYEAYYRTNFSEGAQFYDGSCPQGIPGCVSPYFDYQHIPWRYFETLQPITMNTANGVIHKASWINDGPEPVWFGPTSEDEMMVGIIMFTTDSTGVIIADTDDLPAPNSLELQVAPNPMRSSTLLQLPSNTKYADVQVFDLLGRERLLLTDQQGPIIELTRGNLEAGMYLLTVRTDEGKMGTAKLSVE